MVLAVSLSNMHRLAWLHAHAAASEVAATATVEPLGAAYVGAVLRVKAHAIEFAAGHQTLPRMHRRQI
jgi:hypothetical protein